MKPNYTVFINTPQELNHSSYPQTGFFELEHIGLLRVKVKLDIRKWKGMLSVEADGKVSTSSRAFPKASFYTLLDHQSGEKINFVFDLYDHAEHFSKVGIEEADYYFKRSYESRFVDAVSIKNNRTIHKFGLCFGTHSKYKRNDALFLIGLFGSNLLLNIKKDRLLFKRLISTWKAQQRHWSFINTSRKIDRFQAMDPSSEKTILFQTRCFLHEKDLDVRQIHEQRYQIIKVLHHEFSESFLGGFIPSKVVLEKYRDAITNVPSEPEKYLDALKKAKIVVYSRGLANSPAWKMAEYLSQGKVIIAERLTTELPVPLEEGKELLYFDSYAELVEKIKLVLSDDALAARLSIQARKYFETHVHPKENIKRILELMLKKKLS